MIRTTNNNGSNNNEILSIDAKNNPKTDHQTYKAKTNRLIKTSGKGKPEQEQSEKVNKDLQAIVYEDLATESAE